MVSKHLNALSRVQDTQVRRGTEKIIICVTTEKFADTGQILFGIPIFLYYWMNITN